MPAKKTENVEDPRLKKLVRVYLKMKGERDLITQTFKDQDKVLETQMSKVKSALLDYCKDNGLEGARTSEGLFYRTTATRYWTNDWAAMGAFVVEHKLPELYEKRLNQGNVKQFLDENPDTPLPGLNVDSEYRISIRRK